MFKIPLLYSPVGHSAQGILVWCLHKWRLMLITLGFFLCIKYISYQLHTLKQPMQQNLIFNDGEHSKDPPLPPPPPPTEPTPSCTMPRLTPGGKDIYALDQLERKPVPICLRSNSTKFAIDFESNLLRLNLESEAYFWNTSKCFYNHIWRLRNKPDFAYRESKRIFEVVQDITKISPDMEYIHLLCYRKNSTNLTYEDYVSHVPIKPALEKLLQDRPANLSPDKFPSILIFGQDSSSHMNFRRHMPKVHDYLVDTMKAVEFHGFNSLGAGTLWSVFPLLSGLDLPEINTQCLEAPGKSVDSCPWIWYDLDMLGYRTSYIEDMINHGIFNEDLDAGIGFLRQPVHYDFRAMTNKLQKVKAPHSVPRCFGTRLTMDVLLENSVKVAYTFAKRNKPFFHFAWTSELTHDRNYMSKYGEAPMLRALKQLHENQLLNNTVLILLSDHGMRYGKMRQTTRQGFLEERLPLLYIYLPKSLRTKYPQAYSNLKLNTDKLITTFDIYEMMKDLTQLENLKEERLLERANVKGIQERRNISLFLPISPHRTCGMIGFSSVYCACMSRTSISANTSFAQGIVELIVVRINEKLSNYSLCARLEIAKITSLYTLNPEVSFADENNRFGKNNIKTIAGKMYEVGFDTNPGSGMYYASVIRNNDESKLEITEISRVSAYDTDADCIKIKELKPFCYCKEKLKTKTL